MKTLILSLITISFFIGCTKKIDYKEETIYLLKTKNNNYLLLNETNLSIFYTKGKFSKSNSFNTIESLIKYIKKNDLSTYIQTITWNPPELKQNIKISPKYTYTIEIPWPKNNKFKMSVIKNLTYFTCNEMKIILNYPCPKSEIYCFGSNICACDYNITSLK
jgi:hypothetical protein